MIRSKRFWIAALAMVALIMGLSTVRVWAQELDEVAIFIEINDTDGDAGIQVFLDADGWDRMRGFDPDGNQLFHIRGVGSMGIQGITELFFESAEPSFDEQPLDEFLALFPEGTYTFNGRTTEGERISGEAELTHAIPAAPILVAPQDGDEVDPDDTVIEWQLVADPPGSSIVGYQVIVEREEPSLLIFSADVGPTTTSVTVPPEFMMPGTEYKYEVLAIEESGNKTISEVEFETEEEDEG